MLNFKSSKQQVAIFLTILAIALSIIDKDAWFLLWTAFCVFVTIILDGCLFLSKRGKFAFSDSAIITGLIIGIVLSSGQPWYIYAATSALAIGSKRIICIRKKHIFNPAAFGIFSAVLFLSATTQWRGTYYWYIFIPAGLFFAYRIRRFTLLFSYASTALSIWGVQALIQHVNIAYIFGYLSYFFISIMLVEPKTTPAAKNGQLLFGVLVAVSIFILTQIGAGFDVELCGLLIGNLAVSLLVYIQKGGIT